MEWAHWWVEYGNAKNCIWFIWEHTSWSFVEIKSFIMNKLVKSGRYQKWNISNETNKHCTIVNWSNHKKRIQNKVVASKMTRVRFFQSREHNYTSFWDLANLAAQIHLLLNAIVIYLGLILVHVVNGPPHPSPPLLFLFFVNDHLHLLIFPCLLCRRS